MKTRHYCAVRRGVLSVDAGRDIAIATREAVTGDDLATLDQTVLGRFRADIEAERTERVESTRLPAQRHSSDRRRPSPDPCAFAGGRAASRAWPPPEEQDPLVKGSGSVVNAMYAGYVRAIRFGGPQRLAQIGVLGWMIVVPMLIGVFAGRWLDQEIQLGDCSVRRRCWMLGLALGCWSAWEMDGERMTSLYFNALPTWAIMLSLAAHSPPGSCSDSSISAASGGTPAALLRRGPRGDDDRRDDRPFRQPTSAFCLSVGEPGRCAAAARDGARRYPHRSVGRRAQHQEDRTMTSPLTSVALFHLGPVADHRRSGGHLGNHGGVGDRQHPYHPGNRLSLVTGIDDPGRLRVDRQPAPWTARSAIPCGWSQLPCRAFVGTLFVFIFIANWSSLVPGVEPPTAHLETDAALALLVFIAVIWFGILAQGGVALAISRPLPRQIRL